MYWALSLVLIFATACGHSPYRGSEVVGADEFVIDSYKIREGETFTALPSDASVMLFGEVGKEGVVNLPNGTMSLKMALAKAGGITLTGDKSTIQVIRGNLAQPKIYTLHWNHILRLPNDSLLVMPGDIIYVASTPISEWNRFISQLLPTLVNINVVSRGDQNIGVVLPNTQPE